MHLNDILTAKIASQLNGCMSTVKVGSVIELLQFSRGFLPRVPNCPELMAVLVSNFRRHGSIQVKDSLKRMSSTRLMVKHPKRDVEVSTNQSDDRNDDNNNNKDDDDDDNGESNDNWRDAICTSDKRLYAKLGYKTTESLESSSRSCLRAFRTSSDEETWKVDWSSNTGVEIILRSTDEPNRNINYRPCDSVYSTCGAYSKQTPCRCHSKRDSAAVHVVGRRRLECNGTSNSTTDSDRKRHGDVPRMCGGITR
jgi:hypothetical protein